MMDITRRLASFAAELSYQDLPKDVVERTKRVFLDGTGITVAFTQLPLPTILRVEMSVVGG